MELAIGSPEEIATFIAESKRRRCSTVSKAVTDAINQKENITLHLSGKELASRLAREAKLQPPPET